MSKYLLSTAILGALFIGGSALAGVVAPVSVTASNTFNNGFYTPDNLINGSGLSGGIHDGNFANMWMTEQEYQSATLVFDLGAAYGLTGIDIWNYNQDFGMGYSLARSAKDFKVSVSIDGVSYIELLADTLDKATGLPSPAESFDLDGYGRYVKLELLNNYGDQYTAVGLSEVRFEVPEPASLALLAAGAGLLGLARRRKA